MRFKRGKKDDGVREASKEMTNKAMNLTNEIDRLVAELRDRTAELKEAIRSVKP